MSIAVGRTLASLTIAGALSAGSTTVNGQLSVQGNGLGTTSGVVLRDTVNTATTPSKLLRANGTNGRLEVLNDARNTVVASIDDGGIIRGSSVLAANSSSQFSAASFGGTVTAQASAASTGGSPYNPSVALQLQGSYWTGSANANSSGQLQFKPTTASGDGALTLSNTLGAARLANLTLSYGQLAIQGNGSATTSGLLLQDTTTTTTAPNKLLRANGSNGRLEVLNSALSTVVLSVSDTGSLTCGGAVFDGSLTLTPTGTATSGTPAYGSYSLTFAYSTYSGGSASTTSVSFGISMRGQVGDLLVGMSGARFGVTNGVLYAGGNGTTAGGGAGLLLADTTNATTPNKLLRANGTNGRLEVLNSALTSVIASVSDAGALTVNGLTSNGQLNIQGNGTGTATGLLLQDTTTTTSAPSKLLRANGANGSLEIVNNALTAVIASVTDAGVLTLAAGASIGGSVTLRSNGTATSSANAGSMPLYFGTSYWNNSSQAQPGYAILQTGAPANTAGDTTLTLSNYSATALANLSIANGRLYVSGASATSGLVLRDTAASTTPSKWIRANGTNGKLEVLNDAQTAVIASVDDAGNVAAAGSVLGAVPHVTLYGVLAAGQSIPTGADTKIQFNSAENVGMTVDGAVSVVTPGSPGLYRVEFSLPFGNNSTGAGERYGAVYVIPTATSATTTATFRLGANNTFPPGSSRGAVSGSGTHRITDTTTSFVLVAYQGSGAAVALDPGFHELRFTVTKIGS